MSQFSHLAKLDLNDQSIVEYPLTELEGAPVLTLRPANESNKGYTNDLLRMTGQGNGARKRASKVDSKLLSEMREHDKVLYPKHIISSWTGMLDVSGKEVPFSVEAAEEFLQVLPHWIFDGIRTAAATPENFVNVIDSQAKAGN